MDSEETNHVKPTLQRKLSLTSGNIRDVLGKKRDGEELNWEELELVINGIANGAVKGVQLGGFIMACHLKGLNEVELELLMRAVMFSGELLSWPAPWQDSMASLQSTGSTGNKAKLVLAPVMAACGLKFPIMARLGRDVLGGLLNKLSAIPGFNGTGMTMSDVHALLDDVGCCVVQQPQEVAPAERFIRDTAQQLSVGNNFAFKEACIVARVGALRIGTVLLDIPYGPGETVKTKEDAVKMAQTMGELSRVMGIKFETVITAAGHPVGEMIGQTVEIEEAIKCLQGQAHPDLQKLVSRLGAHILREHGAVGSLEEGEEMVEQAIGDGSAKRKFGRMLQAQGVEKQDVKELLKQKRDTDHIWSVLPNAHYTTYLNVSGEGYVHNIDVAICYEVIFDILTQDEKKTPIGGLQLVTAVGKHLKQGDVWGKIYHNYKLSEDDVSRLKRVVTLMPEPPTSDMVITVEEITSNISLGEILEEQCL